MTPRVFGWLPDLPDHRDIPFVPRLSRAAIPAEVHLAGRCPAIWDQGQIGSCVAHGVARAFVVEHMERSKAGFMPSRLQLYYDARAVRGWQKQDSGCYIRDAIKSVARTGVGAESFWPYVPSKLSAKPPAAVYNDAAKHQSLEYQRVAQTATDIKAALAQGSLVIFGITVYENMQTAEVAKSGAIPMPKGRALGRHRMALTGYKGAVAEGHNSWGTGWGQKGAFTIPMDYLTNSDLAADFWTIRKVEV